MGAPRFARAGSSAASVLLLAGLFVGLLAGLSGCGSDGDDKADDSSTPTRAASSAPASAAATTTPAPPGTRRCDEVWKGGARLPRVYRGCADDAGLLVVPDRLGCSSGQALVRYEDRFWAVAGGPIAHTSVALTKDPDYKKVLASCRG